MRILSSFNPPYIIPDLNDFFFYRTQKEQCYFSIKLLLFTITLFTVLIFWNGLYFYILFSFKL